MCGIAGIAGENVSQIRQNIKILVKNINHRGPDDSGIFINQKGNVALGNTRLAIQDTSDNGGQPFISFCKRYVIIFNGEIYNFKEIKKTLNQYKFKSNSDTEVLLNYYIAKGENCLEDLKGFFSFAIWDHKDNKLFCARDKFGIKPFYYFLKNNIFSFCSEIKPLLKLQTRSSPNINSINSYLTSEYYENIETTFFNDILKLKPGNKLIFQNGKITQKPFWNFYKKYESIKLPAKFKDRQDYFYNQIDKAVKYSLISDTKIAVAASGGLDSSILYHHIKNNDAKISTLISFKFNNQKYSEEKYVKKISKKLNFNISYSNISKDYFFKNIKKSILLHEEPFSGLPLIAYQKCFEDLKNHKVVLDGSGIDEAHGGYSKYYQNNKICFHNTQDGTSLGDIISNNLKIKSQNYNHQLKCNFKNKLKTEMFLDLFYIKIPRSLRFRDKISMANSIELRPSFLDENLICSLMKLDNSWHFNNNFGKWFLRKNYEKIIGKSIVYRNKQQIQTPQREWLRENYDSYFHSKIQKSKLWETNWIDKKKFFNLNNLFLKKKFNNSFFLWKFINLHFWYKNNF